MAKKRKYWKTTIEEHSPPIHVYERSDRNGDLYTSWPVGNTHTRPKLRGIESVRDESGTVDPKLVNKARAQALLQYGVWARERSEADAGGDQPSENGRPLTLRAGFDTALAIPNGKFRTRDQRYRAVEKARDRLLEILGDDLLWSNLRKRHYRIVGRWFIDRWAAGDTSLGFRMMEQTIGVLQAIRNWLVDEEIVEGAPEPPNGWREALKTEWQQATGDDPSVKTLDADPYRPRHTEAEIRRLWAHIEEADPRLQPFMWLGGGEYRGGQVLRGNRSDLDLTPGAGDGHGTFRIRGRGKKLGETIFLTLEEREAVDSFLAFEVREHGGEEIVLGGMLAHFERAFQASEIHDYPLFPGGKLRGGQGVPRESQKRCNRRTMLDKFHALEKAAGVTRVEGRGWYGVRRGSTDVSRKHSQDEAVLDAAGGWSKGSGVRRGTYMDGQHPDVLREAAKVRSATRRGGSDASGPTASPDVAEAVLSAFGVEASIARGVTAAVHAGATAGIVEAMLSDFDVSSDGVRALLAAVKAP